MAVKLEVNEGNIGGKIGLIFDGLNYFWQYVWLFWLLNWL